MRSSLSGWDLTWNILLRAAACLGVNRLRVISLVALTCVGVNVCSLATVSERKLVAEELDETDGARCMG